jgi:hypothetical protein
VASDRFGSKLHPCSSGIILTSSPYNFQLIKGEEFSWENLVVLELGELCEELLRIDNEILV